MVVLILLIIFPLVLILTQLFFGLTGYVGYSIYKIAFIVPPLIYCYVHAISIPNRIVKFRNWRNGLGTSIGIGLCAVLIFWGLYYLLGDLLLDQDRIVRQLEEQFSVTAATVFFIAPFTIILNSLLEEFFYRGFGFGLLVEKNKVLGYLLPATVYTIEHVLFFQEWLDLLPFAIASAGLFIFAIVLEKIYAATNTLVAPWIIHIFGDVAMMGVAVWMLYQPASGT